MTWVHLIVQNVKKLQDIGIPSKKAYIFKGLEADFYTKKHQFTVVGAMTVFFIPGTQNSL